MFGSIGMPELILIFVVALLVFGPRKLPEIGKSLGKGLAEFKRASDDLKKTIEHEIEQGKHQADRAEAVVRRPAARSRRRRRSLARRAPPRPPPRSRSPDPAHLSRFNPRDLVAGPRARPPAGRRGGAPPDGLLRAPGGVCASA